MAVVMKWVEDNLAPYDGAESFDASGSHPGRSGKPPGSGTGATTSKLAGQKRVLQDDDDRDGSRDEDEEDGSGKDRNKKRSKTDVHDDRPRFACPYFKRDPAKFKNARTCCGPGWTEVHRIKYGQWLYAEDTIKSRSLSI